MDAAWSEAMFRGERIGVDELNQSLQENIEFLQVSDEAKDRFKKTTDALKVAQDAYKAAMDRANTSERTRIGLANELTKSYKAQGAALADLMLKQFEAGEQPGMLEGMGISAWWKGKKKPPKRGGKAPTKDWRGLSRLTNQLFAAREEGAFSGTKEGLAILKAENKAMIARRDIQFQIDKVEAASVRYKRDLRTHEAIAVEKLKTQLQLNKELLKVELEKIKAEVDAAELEKAAAEGAAMRLTPSQFLADTAGAPIGSLPIEASDTFRMSVDALQSQIDAIAETRAELFDEFDISLDALNPKLAEYEQSLMRQRDLMMDMREVAGGLARGFSDISSTLGQFTSELASMEGMEITEGFEDLNRAVGMIADGFKAVADASTAAEAVDGTIAAIGRLSASMVKDEKEKAWILFGMEGARAAAAFATGNFVQGAMHTTAAAMFLSVATGAVKASRPSVVTPSSASSQRGGGGGQTTINVHVSGLTTLSEAELGAAIHQAVDTAKSQGYVP
jgi:hypothetical protein